MIHFNFNDLELWDKQDKLTELMIQAYDEHRIPQWYVFTPYIEWKRTKKFKISNAEIREMRSVSYRLIDEYDKKHPDAYNHIKSEHSDDVFQYFRGYKDDAEIVGCLSEINEELTNILILRTP